MGRIRSYLRPFTRRPSDDDKRMLAGYLAFEGIIWGTAAATVALALVVMWLAK